MHRHIGVLTGIPRVFFQETKTFGPWTDRWTGLDWTALDWTPRTGYPFRAALRLHTQDTTLPLLLLGRAAAYRGRRYLTQFLLIFTLSLFGYHDDDAIRPRLCHSASDDRRRVSQSKHHEARRARLGSSMALCLKLHFQGHPSRSRRSDDRQINHPAFFSTFPE